MIHNFFRRFASSDRPTFHSGSRNGSGLSRFSVDWVLPGQLAVGRLPRANDRQALHQAGIRTVLALCAETEGAWPSEIQEQFRCLRYVLPDSHYTARPTARQIGEAVRFIHRSIDKSEPIFVHCLAGIERSPSICIAYLCCYQKNDWQIQAIRDYIEQQELVRNRAIV